MSGPRAEPFKGARTLTIWWKCEKSVSACEVRYVIDSGIRYQEPLLDADAEKTLVASCRKGDKAAYTQLVKVYSGRIFAICLGMLGNPHDAEDAAQQTFLKGFMEIGRLHNPERLGAWIRRIARNVCLDVMRRRRPRVVSMPLYEHDAPNGAEDYSRLEAALAELSERYRVPLLLFYFDGRSTKSIAEALGLTQGVVQTRLSRARKQLRELLQAESEER